MTDELARRWDDEVERAWTTYRRAVADGLVELRGDQEYAVPDLRCRRLPGTGDDDGEIDGVVGDVLHLEVVATPADAEHLTGLGFGTDPDELLPTRFVLERDVRRADEVAWLVVVVLRSVLGVVHPSWLDEAPDPDEQHDAHQDDEAGTSRERTRRPGSEGPWHPVDADSVRICLESVVREMGVEQPVWDSDGDLALTTDACVLHVVVPSAARRLLLSATLLTDVVDTRRAVSEVNLYNRREFGLTFLVDRDRVVVRREMPVSVFQPREVRLELERLLRHLDDWTEELQLRVGGRGVLEEGDGEPRAPLGSAVAEDRLGASLRVLAELQRDDRDGLTPGLLARVFHGDRFLLVAAIDDTRQQETRARAAMRSHEEAGRSRLVAMTRAQLRWHRELRRRLRQALRLTVEAAGARQAQEQLSLFAEEDAAG